MKIKTILFFAVMTSASYLFAQQAQPAATPADARLASFAQRQALAANSIANGIQFDNIGPTVFSGRITDFDINPKDPTHFYVSYASGGLWKSTSNGSSFEPLFDEEAVMTIGDIAVNWDKDIIWVGTGEVNSSRSSYAGVGMYKSTDGGKTWQHKGLSDSHHIGRIVLHPTDANTAWVAVLGHLYSPNKERGVFKTTDGGDTWTKVLYANANAGAIDLIMDSQNPDILYAATWERTRRAWNFTEAGAGSGIHKSTDGGQTWSKVSGGESGFPGGNGIGRIGLSASKSGGKNYLYAVVDNYNRRPKEAKASKGLTKDDLRSISKADFLALGEEKIGKYLKANRFPKKYTAQSIISQVKNDEIKPIALVEFVEDANSLLFDTPVVGAEVYRSMDEGATWQKMNAEYMDGVYNSYGYYFGQIRASAINPDHVYMMGVPVIKSKDGGKTWTNINRENVHVDHHALWLNPNREGHLILGNDGGLNISYDDGETWFKCNSPAVGQFYYIAVDHADDYNVYGGLQDNGVWMGSHNYEASKYWQNSGQYPYKSIMGGDGMQVAVDTRDNATVYTGYQFGNYFRLNTKTNSRSYITPKHELGERPLRWNWQSPIQLSEHNMDIVYFGSNKLHRSMNQGDDFEAISGDLTEGGQKGDVAYGTLTTIHESPMRFGLIYTGSDDGLIHVTKDGGNNWTKISAGLPEAMWVSRIVASKYKESRVYAVLNGYRWDKMDAMAYVSEDYGATWTAIGTDLPMEPLNVIKEDPKNEQLLYVGSDHGLYISLNRGQSFQLMNNDLPAVSVHDVVVHPKTNDLIVGTHGRSIYKANVAHLQALNSAMQAKDLYAFTIDPVNHSSRWGNPYASIYEAPEPTLMIPVYTQTAGKANLSIKHGKKLVLFKESVDLAKGLNYIENHLTYDAAMAAKLSKVLSKATEETVELEAAKNGESYLPKGTYTIVIEQGGKRVEQALVIE